MTPNDVCDFDGMVQRFWGKVVIASEGCWEWQGAHVPFGYGILQTKLRSGQRRPLRANRLSYLIQHGEVPDSLHVLHSYDNPSCVRPDHLFLGTDRDNTLDAYRKGRHIPRDMRGDLAPNHTLSWSDVRTIRERLSHGERPSALARTYGVTNECIYSIRSQRTWKEVSA